MVVTVGDLRKSGSLEQFLLETVGQWRGSGELRAMQEAYRYYLGENPRLTNLANRVAVDTGVKLELKPAVAVYSDFFGRITRQHIGHLMKLPLAFEPFEALGALGRRFNFTVKSILQDAYIRGVSWGLWNGAELVHLPAEAFIPIYDDDSMKIVKGISFERLRAGDVWHYYFYEADGVTRFVEAGQGLRRVGEKSPYRYTFREYGTGTVVESLYVPPVFPIFALHTNEESRSELTLPLRTQINAYDLLRTAYIDETLKTRFIYWVIEGYGGNVDELLKIKETAQKLGIIANRDEGALSPTTIEPPHNAHGKVMRELEGAIN